MDKVTFGSSSFVFVTKSEGLSLAPSSSSANVQVPSQSANARPTVDAVTAGQTNQNISWRSSSFNHQGGPLVQGNPGGGGGGAGARGGGSSRLPQTQIRLVFADSKDQKPSTTFLPTNANKPFCATPLTSSVTILPSSVILPKTSSAQGSHGGRVIAPVAASTASSAQGSLLKGSSSGQTINVIPMNFARSPPKLLPGNNNVMVSLISKGNESASWNSMTTTTSVTKSVQGTLNSPNKVLIQFNSSHMPLVQQPKVAVVNQQRQLASTAFATASGTSPQFVQLLSAPPYHVKTNTDKVHTVVLASASGPTNAMNSKSKSATNATSQNIAVRNNGSTQTNTTQRLILPATSQVQLNMAMANNLFQTVPSSVGATAVAYIAPAGNPQNYTFLQATSAVVAQQPPMMNHLRSKSLEFHATAATGNSSQLSATSSSDFSSSRNSTGSSRQWSLESTTAAGPRPRKPCNCTKSQCLKLYCECFANGEFCHDCNCCNCFNSLEHEDDRVRAIKSCLERNPHAFHPKIGKGGSIRQHNKGCNCKRSGCLKNYCECYEAKILCSNLCRCVGCRNFEESADGQTLLQLADAAEVRVQQQTAADIKLSSQILGPPVKPPQAAFSGERLPYTFVTMEVIEAMSSCLMAEMEETERFHFSHSRQQDQEHQILLEFGRCLAQVIETASRTRPTSPQP